MEDVFSKLKGIWDKKANSKSGGKSHLKRSNSFSFSGSKEDKRERAITRRNRIKDLLNNFLKLLKGNDLVKIEHYLQKIDLIFENEWCEFQKTDKKSRNDIDVFVFDGIDDEYISAFRPIPSGFFTAWNSKVNEVNQEGVNSFKDCEYSIFGSEEINKLIVKCFEGYKEESGKFGSRYDGNRAMVGIRNLYDDLGKIKKIEDANKLYKNKKSLINSYYSEIVGGLISILDGLKKDKLESIVRNFDKIKKGLEKLNKEI